MDSISTIEAKISGTAEFSPIYDTLQRLESFHTMAHDQELLGVAGSLLDAPPTPQPSTTARVIFPSDIAHTTLPHQDFILVQGTPEVWTSWIPLGACPHSMGGLAVLRGSHVRGVLPVFDPGGSIGAGALGGVVGFQSVRVGRCTLLPQQDRPPGAAKCFRRPRPPLCRLPVPEEDRPHNGEEPRCP